MVMNPHPDFLPTRDTALARIAAVNPAAYARTRNAINGAVTQLSPYITHSIVSLPEVLAGVAARHAIDVQHKFVFELGWRAYFRHVWQHRGESILHSLHAGPLTDAAYLTELPNDIRQACTGVPVIDAAVRTLYASGMLHNHARMWLASYIVHLRKVHWRVAADWLVSHLLDGDLASNHLSWQWVAGTGSSKPYLFNAENVARYAPATWHSPGSMIDCSYEVLDVIARQPVPVRSEPSETGVEEPGVASIPDGWITDQAQLPSLAGRDICLVHPWALGPLPADLPANTLCLGLWLTDYHQTWPWSQARWTFVGTRMTALTSHCIHIDRERLTTLLRGAQSVHTVADPHISRHLPDQVLQRRAPALFAEVDRRCDSFSTWWKQATRGVTSVHDLPGLNTMI